MNTGKSILLAIALIACGPAEADAIARMGADWARITALPCKNEAVIAVITAAGLNPKDFRAASGQFEGRMFNACAFPDWDGRVIQLRYEDGDAGFIPFEAFKPAPEA